jgi:hypothetical protein
MFYSKFFRVAGAAVLAALIPLGGVTVAGAADTSPGCSVLTQNVYQVNNPSTAASVLTRNAGEVKTLISSGFSEDKGVAFKASSRLVAGLTPVYRMVKGSDYVWIPKLATVGEFESAKKSGYAAKHVEFYASTSQLDCTVPVTRLYKGDIHRFTANAAEVNALVKAGWTNEGVRFWATPTAPVTTPVPPVVTPAPAPTTPAPTPEPSQPAVDVAAFPVKNLAAKTAYTAAKITWEHADITGTLTKYVVTATSNDGYNRTFYTKENTVTFAGLNSGVAYKFVVTTEAISADGKKKATAETSVTATTPVPPVTAPTPTIPPVVTPPVVTPPTTPPVAADPADWVRWENIAQPGENLNQVLAKPALTGKVLKLPAGVFEISDFRDVSAAFRIPKTVKGLIGSGNDTIIRIKPNTSTYGWSVPTQAQGGTNQLYILRMNNGVEPQILSDVWFQGTEQGHLYNGIMIGQSKPGTTVERILVTGVPGDAGAPPGETFGIGWWQTNGGITRDVEVDGYRWTGDTFKDRVKGEKVGASPIGWSSSNDAKLYNAYTHDSLNGMPTFWQSNNAETWNLQSIRNNAGLNHEESFGIVHHQPVIYGSANHQHVGFMSQRGDGKLTIIGATTDTWTGVGNEPGPIGKGNKMLVITPKRYGTDGNKIVTRPIIVLDDGVTPHPFTWAN